MHVCHASVSYKYKIKWKDHFTCNIPQQTNQHINLNRTEIRI